MFDEKTIWTRLVMALNDAILIEQTPVRRYEMERLQRIMRERYKPGNASLETKDLENREHDSQFSR